MAIKLRCKVKVKHNFKRFNQIEKKLPQAIANGIEEVLKTLQTEAIRLEKGHNKEMEVFSLQCLQKKRKGELSYER